MKDSPEDRKEFEKQTHPLWRSNQHHHGGLLQFEGSTFFISSFSNWSSCELKSKEAAAIIPPVFPLVSLSASGVKCAFSRWQLCLTCELWSSTHIHKPCCKLCPCHVAAAAAVPAGNHPGCGFVSEERPPGERSVTVNHYPAAICWNMFTISLALVH